MQRTNRESITCIAVNAGRTKVFGDLLGSPTSHCTVSSIDLDFLDEEKSLATELGKGDSGFDATAPSLFISEGLVMYLGSRGKLKLIADVSAVAAPGSVFVLQFLDGSQSAAAKDNPEVLVNALSVEEATRELKKHGWTELEFSQFGDEKLSFGRYPIDQFKPSASFSFCVCKKAGGGVL
eukprot:SAG31_NODE_4299_length_3373_cov_1.830483_3_plen_180_part_00